MFKKLMQLLSALFGKHNNDNADDSKPTPTPEPEPETPVVEPEPGIKPEPETPTLSARFLTTNGRKIVNQNGTEVFLKGVNLGGWLLHEYWMCPVKSNTEQPAMIDILTTLEKRFGESKAQELIYTYQENWLTENDAKLIKDMGCNVVRLPFWYRNFMKDANGTWLTENHDDNPGFIAIDKVLEVCEQYGIYVVLDMHGCPGGQSVNHCSGGHTIDLFKNAHYQDAMEELWVTIADRYKNNSTVAMYDIMNEPCDYGGAFENFNDLCNGVYDRMYKAIRSVDPNHMITIEGIWGLEVLPDPKAIGWDNVVYQTHYYTSDGKSTVEGLCAGMANYSQKYDIPVYLGEFSNMIFPECCKVRDIHFTSWTYKGSVDMDGHWFAYHKWCEQADINNDSFDTIKSKWGKRLYTTNFTKDTVVIEAFR